MGTQVPPSKQKLPPDQRFTPTPDLYYPADYKEVFAGRAAPSKVADPCAHASKASMACLERAYYNKSECTEFFKAYKECKKRWLDQMKEDRRKGLR